MAAEYTGCLSSWWVKGTVCADSDGQQLPVESRLLALVLLPKTESKSMLRPWAFCGCWGVGEPVNPVEKRQKALRGGRNDNSKSIWGVLNQSRFENNVHVYHWVHFTAHSALVIFNPWQQEGNFAWCLSNIYNTLIIITKLSEVLKRKAFSASHITSFLKKMMLHLHVCKKQEEALLLLVTSQRAGLRSSLGTLLNGGRNKKDRNNGQFFSLCGSGRGNGKLFFISKHR